MLTPTDKGNIAEVKIAAAATELGINVSLPLSEGRRYDLILDLGHRLIRVQCKWASLRGEVICARTGTSRYTPSGYVRTTYNSDEIDAIAMFCPDNGESYLLPIADFQGRTFVHLRLGPCRNKQRAGVRMASDYRLGAIAQLGERRYGIPKVAGSSPASSTPPVAQLAVGAHELRDRFGYWMQEAAAGTDVLVTRHGKPMVTLTAAGGPTAAARP